MSELKFKVGDLVVVDYDCKRNGDGAYPYDGNGVYEISHVYLYSSTKVPFVKIKGKFCGYYQERFKLAKNHIVTQILNDL